MSVLSAPTRATTPDPRIAARRQAVESDRRRRVRRRLALVALAVTVVAGAWLAAHSPAFDVDTVDATGASNQPVAEILAVAGVQSGDALVWIDGGEIAAAVDALPWVSETAVTRDVRNGRVVIAVTERVPVAAVAAPDGLLLVDADGRVLAWAAGAGNLPVIQDVVPGPPGTRLEPADRQPLEVAAALPPGLASNVAELRTAADGTVEMALRDGGIVRLGLPDDLATKVRTLQTVLANVDLSCLAAVDVTVPDTAVLTRGEACA
jgi:cell division septal protein FtsQ